MVSKEYKHRQNSVALARLGLGQISDHRGEFAVLVDGQVREYHKTNREAILAARDKYSDVHYSVCKVEPQPADVGFIDLADYHR